MSPEMTLSVIVLLASTVVLTIVRGTSAIH
jgi:hypothetical protein